MIREEEYKICAVFGCGKKLSLQEQLFGDKCIQHSSKEIKTIKSFFDEIQHRDRKIKNRQDLEK